MACIKEIMRLGWINILWISFWFTR